MNVILAGGRGSRLVPDAPEFQKPLYVIDGVPLVLHAAGFARAFGGETVVVTNPANDVAIRLLTGLSTVVQPEPLGPVDALLRGVGDHRGSLLLLCSDNTFEPSGSWFRTMVGHRSSIAVQLSREEWFSFVVNGMVSPRGPSRVPLPRWVGPVYLSYWAGYVGFDLESTLNANAVNGFNPVFMRCRDHGIAS